MIARYRIWRERRYARLLSRYTDLTVTADIGAITVGRFRKGREVS